MELRTMDKMTTLPGPRFKWQGEGSGEEFRDDHLIHAFDQAVKQGETLLVDMDGARKGYPTSFLEEAFGGLARQRGIDTVKATLRIKSTDEPMLKREIAHYVHHCEQRDPTIPFVPPGDFTL